MKDYTDTEISARAYVASGMRTIYARLAADEEQTKNARAHANNIVLLMDTLLPILRAVSKKRLEEARIEIAPILAESAELRAQMNERLKKATEARQKAN